MKILQVISSLGNGGAEKFVGELSNELSANNKVTLCTFKSIENWMMFPKRLKPEVELVSLNKGPGFELKTISKLLKLIRQFEPDAIHLHLDGTLKYFIPIIPFVKTKKIFYTIHSNLNSDKIRFFDQLNKIKFVSGKITFVCISESIYTEFKQKYPHFEFILIDNGISKMNLSAEFEIVRSEIDTFKEGKDRKLFLTISNFTEPKNLPLIVHSFKRLYEEQNDSILLIIGNDANNNELHKELERIKSPNTHLIGLKNNVQDYMYFADAYCLCSIFEGLPISILEAYSYGKPVISTPAGGVPSILKNGVNGFLSNDFSLESYYKSIINFLNSNDTELETIKTNNLNYFNTRFDIKFASQNYFLKYTN